MKSTLFFQKVKAWSTKKNEMQDKHGSKNDPFPSPHTLVPGTALSAIGCLRSSAPHLTCSFKERLY